MADIKIEDLSFSYAYAPQRKVLDHIDMSVSSGEYVVICGKSGSGKTTLLKQIKSALSPAGERSGEIYIDGEPLFGMKEGGASDRKKPFVGYVFQNPAEQTVTDKVWHEIAFGLENIGEKPEVIRMRVAEMASYFGMNSWMERDVNTLSGGQLQLLNLASVMAMQPDILILDEPASQLDPIAASDFLATVKKINTELGTTVIITEHRLEDICPGADKVFVMEEGKIIACGSSEDVCRQLYESGNDMFRAMPTAARIYLGSGADVRKKIPLTVKEGRMWLAKEKSAGISDKENKAANGQTGAPESRNAEIAENDKCTGRYSGADKDTDSGNYAGADKHAEKSLDVKDLWFRYEKNGRDILKGVDLKTEPGKIYAIAGGNGSGKTTLLKCICGISKPYKGKVKTSLKTAMLPQNAADLFVKQSVREELEEMLGAARSSALEREVEVKGFENVPLDEKVCKMAKMCMVEHILKSHPFDISEGEKHRVALAKVLMTDADILLLDEPTKGMDCFFKEQFASILEDIKKKGKTIIMVSHDIEFCAMYADCAGMFFNGQLITMAQPEVIFENNNFYTTAANRMSRGTFKGAVTVKSIINMLEK